MPIQIIPPDTPQYDQFGRRIQQPVPVTAPQQPVAPVANIPAPVAQEQQQQPLIPAPDFSPVKIIPDAPTASEAALAQERPLDPNAPEYQNSRLRTVLNAIAGGLAGASGGPKVGFEVGENLRNLKYNEAVAAQNRRIAMLGEQGKAEQAQFKRGESSVIEGIKQGAAQSSDVFRAGNLLARNRDLTNKEQETQIKKQRADAMQKYNEWKMRPENADAKKDFWQYIKGLPEDSKERADALDAYATEQALKATAKPDPGQAAFERTMGTNRAMLTPEGQQVTSMRAAAGPAARTAEEQKLVTPDVVQNVKDLIGQDPATAMNIIKSYPPAAKAKLFASAGIPASIPAREQERLFNTKITLNHVETAEKLAGDPEIRSLLGPLSGRIEILKGKLGTGEDDQLKLNTEGLSQDQAFKMGRFINFLNYMIVWESTTLSGTRPAQRLIESLRETGARPSEAYPRLMGALQAIRDSVANTEKGILPNAPSSQERRTGTDTGKPLTEEERKKKFLDSFTTVPTVQPPKKR